MKKVLVTGSTASQCSAEAHRRSARFSGMLVEALTSIGFDVDFKELSVDTPSANFESYDSVIVGLAPISSLSAHRIYPALSALYYAIEQGKATVLFDAPEPHLAINSFKYTIENPTSLVKNLYGKRSGYWSVANNFAVADRILAAVERVAYTPLTTIIPSVPFYTFSATAIDIPTAGNSSNLVQVNFDRGLSEEKDFRLRETSKYWLSENHKNKWSKTVEKTLSKPVLPLRRSAYDTAKDLSSRIHDSYGVLFGTYKDGLPWWSPNVMLSLNSGVPVFSDWKVTASLGDAWTLLPHQAEDMTYEERFSLATMQLTQYLNACPEVASEADRLARRIF